MSKHGNTAAIRFAASQRIEHILLMVSFSMLCLTAAAGTAAPAGAAILGVFGGYSRLARCTTSLPWYHADAHRAVVVVCELILVAAPTAMLPVRRAAGLSFLPPQEKPRYRYDFRQKVSIGR